MVKLSNLFGDNLRFIVAVQKQTKNNKQKKNANIFCRKCIFHFNNGMQDCK